MKRLLSIFLTICVMLSLAITPAFAATASTTSTVEAKGIKIIVNGKQTEYTTIKTGATILLPMKQFLVSMGIKDDNKNIIFDAKKKTISIKLDKTTLLLELSKNIGKLNGKQVKLDAAPVLYKNIPYIPAISTSKLLGKKVIWDGQMNVLMVTETKNFDIMKELFPKINKAMAVDKITKQAGTMKIKMDMLGMKVDVEATQQSVCDMENKVIEQLTEQTVMGQKTKVTSYIFDNALHMKTGDTAWQVIPLTGVDFESAFDAEQNEILSTDSASVDSLYASFVPIQTANKDEIVFGGDIFSKDTEKVFLQSSQAEKGQVYKMYMKYTIDKNTFKVKSYQLNMAGDVVTQGVVAKFEAVCVYNYVDVGDYKITIPQELISVKPTT